MNSHDILVVRKYTSGVEEWMCPTCGRRFIVQWTPEYQFIVLDAGDISAIHNMSRGALVMNQPAPMLEENLEPWAAFLNGIDLESELGEEN